MNAGVVPGVFIFGANHAQRNKTHIVFSAGWPAPRFLVHLVRETALNIQIRIDVGHSVR